jgi:protein subunit release factor A
MIDEVDLEILAISPTCVRVEHISTGNSVTVCTEGTQLKNSAKAINALHYLVYPEAWTHVAA